MVASASRRVPGRALVFESPLFSFFSFLFLFLSSFKYLPQ